MALLSKDGINSVFDKIKSYSTAQEIQVALEGGMDTIIRFAGNEVLDTSVRDHLTIRLTLISGGQCGVATGNSTDDNALKNLVKKAETLAAQVGNQSAIPPFYAGQPVKDSLTWSDHTAALTEEHRVQLIADSITYCADRKLKASGSWQDKQWFNAVINTKGLFCYQKSSPCRFEINARTLISQGSGYASAFHFDIYQIKPLRLAEEASAKAQRNTNAKTPETGKIPVILEARAVGDLIQAFLFKADPVPGLKSVIPSQELKGLSLSGKLSVSSDPYHKPLPFVPFTEEGIKMEKSVWIDKGKLLKRPSHAVPVIMEGGTETLDGLIKKTGNGLLITRLHQVCQEDLSGNIFTGVTRDGTYQIEDGKVKQPVKNMRFQVDLTSFFSNIDGIGTQEIVDEHVHAPLKSGGFYFSAVTDSY